MHNDKVTNYLITVPIHQSKSEEIGQCINRKHHNKVLHTRIYNKGSGSVIISSLMNYLFKILDTKIKTVAPYNQQSLQAEHGIKSLLTF